MGKRKINPQIQNWFSRKSGVSNSARLHFLREYYVWSLVCVSTWISPKKSPHLATKANTHPVSRPNSSMAVSYNGITLGPPLIRTPNKNTERVPILFARSRHLGILPKLGPLYMLLIHFPDGVGGGGGGGGGGGARPPPSVGEIHPAHRL